MWFFKKDDFDDNNKYYKISTTNGDTFYAHYRKDPEWLLHEYFTGISVNLLLRNTVVEFKPKPFNGQSIKFDIKKYDGVVELTPKQFEKIISKYDKDNIKNYLRHYFGLKEIENDPSSNKEDKEYVIFDSEIGPLYCYKYDHFHYEEFFTGFECGLSGHTLMFKDFNVGFKAENESPSGNDTLAVRKVSRQDFAVGVGYRVEEAGFKQEVAKKIIEQIRIKIEQKNKAAAEYKAKEEKEKHEALVRQRYANDAINKYGIK